jgi:hypothetical protein
VGYMAGVTDCEMGRMWGTDCVGRVGGLSDCEILRVGELSDWVCGSFDG